MSSPLGFAPASAICLFASVAAAQVGDCRLAGRVQDHPTIFALLVVATEKLRDGPDKGNLLLMSDHVH